LVVAAGGAIIVFSFSMATQSLHLTLKFSEMGNHSCFVWNYYSTNAMNAGFPLTELDLGIVALELPVSVMTWLLYYETWKTYSVV
jgi:hypothetical protein